jgi:hypothetical protein
MGHLNIYLPNKLENQVRREAKRRGKSVSKFLAETVEAKLDPPGKKWASLEKVWGSIPDFPDIERLPSREVPEF